MKKLVLLLFALFLLSSCSTRYHWKDHPSTNVKDNVYSKYLGKKKIYHFSIVPLSKVSKKNQHNTQWIKFKNYKIETDEYLPVRVVSYTSSDSVHSSKNSSPLKVYTYNNEFWVSSDYTGPITPKAGACKGVSPKKYEILADVVGAEGELRKNILKGRNDKKTLKAIGPHHVLNLCGNSSYKKNREYCKIYTYPKQRISLNINDCRKVDVFKLAQKYNLFQRKFKNEKRVELRSVEFQRGPQFLSLKYYKHNNEGLLILKNAQVSFNKKALVKIIPKEFKTLSNLITKQQTNLVFSNEVGEKAKYKLTYFDARPVYSKIEEIKARGIGYIRLTADKKDVDVYIDDVKIGSITKNPFVGKLWAGTHRIQAQKDFFGSKTITVNLEKDDAFAYHFELKPSGNLAEEQGTGKIVQSTGELVVGTTRADLTVLIDGAKRIPPFKLPNISSGHHKMKILGPGINKTMDVLVKENGKTLVDLDSTLY